MLLMLSVVIVPLGLIAYTFPLVSDTANSCPASDGFPKVTLVGITTIPSKHVPQFSPGIGAGVRSAAVPLEQFVDAASQATRYICPDVVDTSILYPNVPTTSNVIPRTIPLPVGRVTNVSELLPSFGMCTMKLLPALASPI